MKSIGMDKYGNLIVVPDDFEFMGSPVRCRCGEIYDLQAVHVTHRYADCSVFQTPCCNRQADDRTWKSLPDFERLTK